METRLELILTAWVVCFTLSFGHSSEPVFDRAANNDANDEGRVQENFQNLMYSIVNNDAGKGDRYRGILKDEVTKERRAFYAMNKNFRISRFRNANGKQNVYEGTSASKIVALRKRETNESSNATAMAPVTKEQREKTEARFAEQFPSISGLKTLDSLEWELAENITEEILEKICRDVASAISLNQTTYIPPKDHNVQERVIKEAPILFSALRYITYTRILICAFAEMKFFLAPGGCKEHVFCLTWEMNHIYCFRSGPHTIHY